MSSIFKEIFIFEDFELYTLIKKTLKIAIISMALSSNMKMFVLIFNGYKKTKRALNDDMNLSQCVTDLRCSDRVHCISLIKLEVVNCI